MLKPQVNKEKGFTILEIMIATVVVSVILVLITSVMIGLQNLYNKGLNEERAQDNVRSIVDQIAQEIQASGSVVLDQPGIFTATIAGTNYPVNAYCIGSVRYLFVTGLQLGSQTQQSLWRDSSDSGNKCVFTPTNSNLNIIYNNPNSIVTDNGKELIANGARLTYFKILPPFTYPNDPNYTIQLSIAYGNDNQLNPFPFTTTNAKCNGGAGDQFCATASLSTEVAQRDNTTLQPL